MTDALRALLIAVVLSAAWCDIRTRRIPNWITVTGATLGLALHLWFGGLWGVALSLAGAVSGLLMFIIFYIAGGMGGGDVKLFSAVGALMGPQALLIAFVFTGLIGGIAAIGLSVLRGRLRQTLWQTAPLLGGTPPSAGPDALRLPYGAVIAAGTLLALIVTH